MSHLGPSRVSSGITCAASFQPGWWRRHYGLTFPDPRTQDPVEIVLSDMDRQRKLRERYRDLPLGNADPKPSFPLEVLDCRQLTLIAYGAPEMTWSPQAASWWHDRSASPLGWIRTAEEITRLPIPKWESFGPVQAAFRLRDQVVKAIPEVSISSSYIAWSWHSAARGTTFCFANFPTFIDMGPLLLGDDRFFTWLVEEPELAHALLEKCLEIALSYNAYVRRELLGDPPVRGVASMGGDYATMLSPSLYEEYAYGFDCQLLARLGNPDLPVNVHSCGPSAHLYEKWTLYRNPVLLNTRWLPGKTAKLRELMPNTHLQLTMAPPQFEFERTGPEQIKEALWRTAEEAEWRDVEFWVLPDGLSDGKTTDGNVRQFYETTREIAEAAFRSGESREAEFAEEAR